MGCGASSQVKPADGVTYPCLRCGKDSPNGPPNQYCCVECKDNVSAAPPQAASVAPRAAAAGNSAPPAVAAQSAGSADIKGKCSRPICTKNSWNGQPGEFCSRVCRSAVADGTDPPDAVAVIGCARSGCEKPSWNGVPGEYCGKACKKIAEEEAAPKVPCAKAGCDKNAWNGQPGEYCGKFCRDSDDRQSSISELKPGEKQYESVKTQYLNKWDTNRAAATPIRGIFAVNQSTEITNNFTNKTKEFGNGPVFGHGTNPGNVQRRFHGTRVKCKFQGTLCKDTECSICRICDVGFDMGKLGKWSGNTGHYGGGFYFTSMSSTAKGYGLAKGYSFNDGNWMKPEAGNALLLVNVACGKVEDVTSQCPGQPDAEWMSNFKSRKIDKGTGVDELVVFDAKQALVSYLIVF